MSKLITLSLIAGLSTFAFAADGNSASATATASVRIVAPLRIISNSNLNFGNIVVNDTATPAQVTMTTAIAPNQLYATPTLSNFKECAQWKTKGTVSAASFHYSYDLGVVVSDVKVTVEPVVTLTGGIGAPVKLTTNNDLPADACFLSDPRLDSGPGTHQSHFGVGGVLDIPAGALGTKTGTINVTVEYI